MELVYINFVPESFTGVKKKIEMQCNAFSNYGYNVIQTGFEKEEFLYDNKPIIKIKSDNRLIRKAVEPLLFYKILSKINKNVDVIYIRYMRITPWYYFFLKKLSKKANKLIVEIPAYPFDSEYKKNSLLSFSDFYFRKKLKNIVDFFTFFGSETSDIWGVPSLQLMNGIDVNSIKIVNKTVKTETLNLLCVASLAKWHGFDRLIKSLASTANLSIREKVIIHIVGDGSIKNNLLSLVNDLGLSNQVNFYGFLNGDKLDEIFNSTSIGVSSLCLHRIGHDNITPIKPSEYTARGIPFILANNDPRFEEANFVFRVKNDESIINLVELYNWYFDNNFISQEIRGYASKYLSWEIQINKIINKIQDSRNN